MREKLKNFGLLIVIHIAGVLIGTLVSAPANALPVNLKDYLSAVMLAPFELTMGIPVVFQLYSDVTGCLVVFGLISTIISFWRAMVRPGIWPQVATFICSSIWSLGNVPVFYAFMSV